MRRKDREITNKSEIISFIKKSNLIHVAISDDVFPYVVPLNYGFRDNAFFIHSARRGRKVELLKKNPQVAFEIVAFDELHTHTDACQWTTKFQSVMGTARAEILETKADLKAGLDVLMEHYGKFDNTYDPKFYERIVIIKLNIIDLTGKQSL